MSVTGVTYSAGSNWITHSKPVRLGRCWCWVACVRQGGPMGGFVRHDNGAGRLPLCKGKDPSQRGFNWGLSLCGSTSIMKATPQTKTYRHLQGSLAPRLTAGSMKRIANTANWGCTARTINCSSCFVAPKQHRSSGCALISSMSNHK